MVKILSVIYAFLLVITAHPAMAQKRIALTFDDVPREQGAFFTSKERSQKIIAALKSAGVKQAAFFVNPAKLMDADRAGGEERIAAYVNAGHVIANHSNTHLHLGSSTAAAYLADIDAAETWLKGRKGYRPWFRFPYLFEGGDDKGKRDAVRAGLKQRGLQNGYVTADGSDWNLEALTQAAQKEGKKMDMKALRRLYVTSQMSAVAYHDEMARMTLGRSPAHVMLLHETDLAAMYIGDFVTELQRNGWRIISADEAFADPIAKALPDVPFAAGTLIGSMTWEKNIDPPFWPIWVTAKMQNDLFEQRVLKKPSAN